MEHREEVVIRQVSANELGDVWEPVAKGIDRLLEKCPDDFTSHDVYWFLKQERATLFLINEGQGFFVLEIHTDVFRGKRTLCVWMLFYPGAMRHRAQIRERIRELGRKAQCQRLQFKSPLLGWKKQAVKEGFRMKLITWECDL